MVTSAQTGQSRYNNFDFLRFFLASLVIFSHSYPLIFGNNVQEPLFRLTHGCLSFGTVAVAGFFAISGYLITKSWMQSRSLGEYLTKRVLRIYPGWIVALLFCVLLIAPLGRPDHALHLRDPRTFSFFDQLLLHGNGIGKTLPGLFENNHYHEADGSTWTIPFEFLCYFLVAGLGLVGALRSRFIPAALFATMLIYVNALPHAHSAPTPVWHLPYLGLMNAMALFVTYYLAGMMFFMFRDVIPYSRSGLAVSLVALVIALASGHGYFLVLPLFGFYVMFYAAFSPSLRLQNFGRYGDFSYGMYLYAWPVQQLLVQYAGPHLTPHRLFAVAWPITLALAILSWRFVEKPFLKLKPKVRPTRVPLGPTQDAEAAAVPLAETICALSVVSVEAAHEVVPWGAVLSPTRSSIPAMTRLFSKMRAKW